MNTVADYTTPALMVPELQARTHTEAIAELCSLLERAGRLPDAAAFREAVLKREQLSSTATTHGWALPHGRLNGLPRLSFALARSSKPFAWSADAFGPVHTVFLFATPEAEAKNYLTLICAVARMTQRSALVEQLRRAADAAAMFSLLQQVPLRPGALVSSRRGMATAALAG